MSTSIKWVKNIILYIVVPLLVASVISLMVLNFMGVKLPDNIRNILPSFTFKEDIPESQIDAQKIKSLETTIHEQQKKIESMETIITEKKNEINDLSTQFESYKQEVSEDKAVKEEQSNANKQVLNILAEMKAEDAAAVLTSMEKNEVVLLLEKMDQTLVADILSEMEAEQAAEYLQLIKYN